MTSKPVRSHDVETIRKLYASMGRNGRGRTVFIAGDDEAGRTRLLHDVAAAVDSADPRAAIVGGMFDADGYVPWCSDRSAAAHALERFDQLLGVGESVATLGGVLFPGLDKLLGQLLAKSRSAARLGQVALAASRREADELLVPRVLRGLCQEGPAICLIDAADEHSGGLLADLAGIFARRISLDLPLLLVLTLKGRQHLGPHEDAEPEILNVARQLSAPDVNVATWHWLAPLTVAELQQWLDPTADDVVQSIVEITDGQSGWAISLWCDWCERNVIEDLTGREWRFAKDRDRRLDDVDDILDSRLRRVGSGDLNALARAQRTLACAALEGRRFTAPALAAALDRDVDDTIDYLDDTLTRDNEHPDAFVIDDGFRTVSDEQGTRHLATYRFARELDWLALRHHGLSDNERHYLSRRLAPSLAGLYGGEAHHLAYTLARLFESGDEPAASRSFHRMAELGTNRDVILWRARNILRSADPVDPAERQRAMRLLIAASTELAGGPFEDGLAYARVAARLAEQKQDRADIMRLAAHHLVYSGAYDEARVELHGARALYVELRDRRGEGGVLFVLAKIERLLGNYEQARARFVAVLAFHRELKDREGESKALQSLGVIDFTQGRFDDARGHLLASLEIDRALGNSDAEAAARHMLANVARELGDYDAARTELQAVLAVRRECHDQYNEASILHAIAMVDRDQGHYDRARTGWIAALKLRRHIGDRDGEAETHRELGFIYRAQGDHNLARAAFAAALELYRELNPGNSGFEAECVQALRELDHG